MRNLKFFYKELFKQEVGYFETTSCRAKSQWWDVKTDNAQRASVHTDTKAEAIDLGRKNQSKPRLRILYTQ